MPVSQHLSGAHLLLYSYDADADRAFLRDVLGLPSVDVGHGWLIFGLPQSEIAVHPADGGFTQSHGGEALAGAVLYLMTADLDACMQALRTHNVACSSIQQANWGRSTTFAMPSGARLGLYQPSHPSPPAL